MERKLSKLQSEFVNDYLVKSKDSLFEFMNKNPKSKVIEVKDVGWLEYAIKDDIFWIHTAYSKVDHSFTKLLWERIIEIAKQKGCTKIQCSTRRNPKAFERLFKLKPVQWKLELKLD